MIKLQVDYTCRLTKYQISSSLNKMRRNCLLKKKYVAMHFFFFFQNIEATIIHMICKQITRSKIQFIKALLNENVFFINQPKEQSICYERFSHYQFLQEESAQFVFCFINMLLLCHNRFTIPLIPGKIIYSISKQLSL